MHGTETFFHINCCGLSNKWDNFKDLLCDLHTNSFTFDYIGNSESFNCENVTNWGMPASAGVRCDRRRLIRVSQENRHNPVMV